MLAEVPKIAKPGDRLFVGTTDLRKTPLSEAYLYYLLPEYPPATYYIEMDPGVANAKGSRHGVGPALGRHRDPLRRVERLGRAQRLPQVRLASSRTGCSREDFCLVGSYGVYRTGDPLYELLKRRPKGEPCPPGTTKPHPKGI